MPSRDGSFQAVLKCQGLSLDLWPGNGAAHDWIFNLHQMEADNSVVADYTAQ